MLAEPGNHRAARQRHLQHMAAAALDERMGGVTAHQLLQRPTFGTFGPRGHPPGLTAMCQRDRHRRVAARMIGDLVQNRGKRR